MKGLQVEIEVELEIDPVLVQVRLVPVQVKSDSQKLACAQFLKKAKKRNYERN